MGICGPSCDIYSPPSRTNMSLFAIIELVIMGVVGILCLVDLYYLLNNVKTWEVLEILRCVEYGFIVVGLALILIGLFCSISQYQIRSGVLCFCIGAILAVVITILILMRKQNQESVVFNILYIIFMTFLAWILWVQSGRLN